jgi:hypothetical protein
VLALSMELSLYYAFCNLVSLFVGLSYAGGVLSYLGVGCSCYQIMGSLLGCIISLMCCAGG